MAYDFNLTRIDNTDTFKEWADKCNAIINGLNSTDFATNTEGIMTLSSDQTVAGRKTFSQSVNLPGGFTTTANYTLGGSTGTINTPTFTVNSGDATIGDGFQAVGARGISFKASSTSAAASIKFENSGTPQKLVFDYAGSGGIFEISDGNKLAIGGSSPTLTVNDYDWNLPATSPGSTASILKWTGSGNNLSWLAESSLVNDLVTDVRDTLQNSNFTLPVNLIPVGTMIAVDSRILDSWPTAGSPAEYTTWNDVPGWIPADGQTLSYDENTSPEDTTYKQLVQLLEGDDSPSSGSTTLPDTIGSPAEDPIGGNEIIYLIKYKSDDTTAFAVSTRTGTAGADGINLFNTSGTEVGTFDITGGKIGLNIDTSVFSFDGAGALSADVDTAATADTLAKRDSAGALTVAEPTEDGHAATKSFIHQVVNDERGGVKAFPELTDGHQNFGGDRVNTGFSHTVVDRYGQGVFTGNNLSNRNGEGANTANYPKGWFNAFSPVTDKVAVFERTFSTTDNYFFIDSDDIIYGTGQNIYGQIGQIDRGSSGDFTDYYSYEHDTTGTSPYFNSSVENPIPALLPQNSKWPANAVAVDTVTYNTTRGDSLHLIAKTKDGVDKSYVNDDRLQGLGTYQTDDGVPYTRGWLIGISGGASPTYALGGSQGSTDNFNGSRVFGLADAGTSLWATFGVTDAERNTSTAGINNFTSEEIDKVNKRFHYYKRNATKAGGLGETDGAALTAWRDELGLTGGEVFDDYSYYVKKTVVSNMASYLIVGKPGNESENELWFAGFGQHGAAGNGTESASMNKHVPVTEQSGTTLSLSIGVVAGTSNTVFESTTAHGFADFEQIRIGTSGRYYIIRGDQNNDNLTTRFRLFAQESAAYNGLIGVLGGTSGAYANSGIGSQVLTHYKKIKGIFDISVGWEDNDFNNCLARRTTDTTTDTAELDSLPESEFTNVSVLSWGNNSRGQLGLGNTTKTLGPQVVSLGTTDRPVDIISMQEGGNSFVITENLDGNRSIYVAGRNDTGLNDVGTIIAGTNTATFTKSTTIDSGWWVKKVFATGGSESGDGYRGQIFIVAESKTNPDVYALFAGGHNNDSIFGSNTRRDLAVLNYIRVRFPEDPKNIVALRSDYGTATYALCKTEKAGETAEEFALKAGRMYGAGIAQQRFGNTHLNRQSSWHPMDGQVLST